MKAINYRRLAEKGLRMNTLELHSECEKVGAELPLVQAWMNQLYQAKQGSGKVSEKAVMANYQDIKDAIR